MTTTTIETTAVERAQLALRDAIATGTERQIDRASRALQTARDAEARRIARAKDKLAAQIQVERERQDRERVERQERADEAESLVRASTPEITFVSCGRRATVLMSAPGLSMAWSVEACRRLAWGAAKNFSERIVASRNLGAAAPESDWLAPLMQDQTHGIELHLRRGVVRVEEIK